MKRLPRKANGNVALPILLVMALIALTIHILAKLGA